MYITTGGDGELEIWAPGGDNCFRTQTRKRGRSLNIIYWWYGFTIHLYQAGGRAIRSAPTRWGFLRVEETGRVFLFKKKTTRDETAEFFLITLAGRCLVGVLKTNKPKVFFFNFIFKVELFKKVRVSEYFFSRYLLVQCDGQPASKRSG